MANLLNEQGKGNIAALLVRAVLSYQGHCQSSIDPRLFESMKKEMVDKQLGTITNKPPETEMISEENASLLNSFDQKNILNGLAGFRKK